MEETNAQPEQEFTLDKYSGLTIRPTDNSPKEGDFWGPQDPISMKLDKNGLPEYAYDHIEEAKTNGDS